MFIELTTDFRGIYIPFDIDSNWCRSSVEEKLTRQHNRIRIRIRIRIYLPSNRRAL